MPTSRSPSPTARRSRSTRSRRRPHPPATVFTDAKDVTFDSTIRYDASFFEHLDRIVQNEPWLDRDRAMIDQLKSLGIEKGKPFRPGAETKTLLASAAREAGAWLEQKYDAGLPPFFSATSRWTFPAPAELVKAAQDAFSDPNAYPVDERGLAYSYAFVGIKRLGAGQFYLISIRDKDGQSFDGGKTYRLQVPADCAGRAVLVGDRLRSPNPCPDPQHAARQPLLADPRDAEERGRLDRRLFRTAGSGGQG